MWRLAVIGLLGCGRHLNPEWCAQPGHSDPACPELADARPDGQLDARSDAAGGCRVDAECPDTACLPGGVCAAPSAALYASPGGNGTACTSDAKCLLATAISQARPARKIILLEPGTYTGAVVIDHDVQIVGSRATLAAATGVAVTVVNAAAELDGIAITGATGSAISCPSGSLRAYAVQITDNDQGITSGCPLTLERSIVSANRGGAIAITGGRIDIHDNFIVNNGRNKLTGTANVTIAAGATGSFAFNTVAYNDAKQNTNPGVTCDSATVTGDGNLVTDNTQKGAFNVLPQVDGVCDFRRSYTMAGVGGNDLHWVDVASDFHLTVASTAALDIDGLTCGGVDFDGDPRPIGGRCDYGADEFRR